MKFSIKDKIRNVYKRTSERRLLFERRNKELRLNLKYAEDVEFMRKSGDNIISKVPELAIQNAHVDTRLVKDFIHSSFPKRVERFHFNHQGEMMPYDEFDDLMLYISPQISQGLFLYKLELSQSQLESFFQNINEKIMNVGL